MFMPNGCLLIIFPHSEEGDGIIKPACFFLAICEKSAESEFRCDFQHILAVHILECYFVMYNILISCHVQQEELWDFTAVKDEAKEEKYEECVYR